MPFPFVVILIAGAVAYVLTSLLFLLTKDMPRTNSGAGWWAIASLAAGLGYVALLVLGMRGLPAHGEAVYNMLFVVWASALAIGGARFLDRPMAAGRVLVAAAAVSVWLGFFYFIAPAPLPAALAVSLFCGTLNLLLAWRFARASEGDVRRRVIAVALAVSGVHWLDYPLLRPVEWFAPIGFSLCAVVSVTINVLLAGLVLAQFRRRMVAAEQAALLVATRDALTGLGNRFSLDAQYEHAAARAVRSGNGLALLFVDLDDFKPINDRFGHDAGDLVLVNVARRLQGLFRESDIVARLGGDEFVIIATDLAPASRGALIAKAERLVEALREPMVIEGASCAIGASVGVAFQPEHGDTLDHLLAAADQAMYDAKRRGKSGLRVAEGPGPAGPVTGTGPGPMEHSAPAPR